MFELPLLRQGPIIQLAVVLILTANDTMSDLVSPIIDLLRNGKLDARARPFLVRLGDVVEALRGASVHRNVMYDLQNNTRVPYITPIDLTDGEIVGKNLRYVEPHGLENYSIAKNDVIISIRGIIGRVAAVTNDFNNAIVSSQMVILRIKSREVLAEYLHIALSSMYSLRQLEKIKIGKKMEAITVTELLQIIIPIPTVKTQHEVVNRCQLRSVPQSNDDKFENFDVEKLVKSGESDSLEFKSSMRAPLRPSNAILMIEERLRTPNDDRKRLEEALSRERLNQTRSLENEICKTVAAFMNSYGGTLLVGVEDKGTINGIENDFQSFNDKKNWDGWLQHLTNLIDEHIGKEFMMYIRSEAVIINGKTVAILKVKESSRPVFVEHDDNKGQRRTEFYIRGLNTTQVLSIRQITPYINEHWAHLS